ncbi:MAG: arylsulfatase [Planctomycetota bacterium]|jgi:arylsulfatase
MKSNQSNRCLGHYLLVMAMTFMGTGCGDSVSSVSEGQPSAEFLSLRENRVLEKETESIQVVQKMVTTKPSAWVVKGAIQNVTSAKKGRNDGGLIALQLSEPEVKCSVTIAGPFDPQSFNLLALNFRTGSKWELSYDFMVDGRRVSMTPPKVVTPESGLRTVMVDAPHLRRIDGEIDEIVINVEGSKHGIAIAGLDLLWQPDHRFLPDTDAGPQPVMIGREMRSAQGVSSQITLVTDVQPKEGELLRFSYGTPGELTRDEVSARLELTIRPENGEPKVQIFDLDSNFRKAQWRQAMIPLTEYSGQALQLEWSVLAGSDSVCALGEVSLVEPGTKNRVVLFITSDTHRGDHMGAADEGVDVDTPMLDALAQRGVLFEDCFSTTNITNPSHISIMTGIHPRDTGVVNNYTQVARSAPTLAEAFRDAGYITYAAVSTKHLSDPTSGLGQGFDRASFPMLAFARDGSETIKILDDWLEESEGLPIFVWLHVFDAHMPYDKNISGLDRYYGSKGGAFDEDLPVLGAPVDKAIKHLGLKGLRDLEFPRAMYKAEITALDKELGEFIDQPIFDGAVIAFTGDHGESLGNHGIYFAHEELYRESLHVPLILCWPGGPAGLRHSAPVTNLEVGRTLLDLSGNAGTEFPGMNLATLLDGDEGTGEARYSLSAHAREASMTINGWHFQLRLGANSLADESVTRIMHSAELYNLKDDPDCSNDLLDKEFTRAKAMRSELFLWLEAKSVHDLIGSDSGDLATMSALKDLGYTGGGDDDEPSAKATSLAPDPDCSCSWCARFK